MRFRLQLLSLHGSGLGQGLHRGIHERLQRHLQGLLKRQLQGLLIGQLQGRQRVKDRRVEPNVRGGDWQLLVHQREAGNVGAHVGLEKGQARWRRLYRLHN